MVKRQAPYKHLDGSNCWTKDCRLRKSQPPLTFGSSLQQTIETECIRQEETYDSRGTELYRGWLLAKSFSDKNIPLNEKRLLEIAKIVEPDNKGKLRQTPVTFRNGGYSVPAQNVPRNISTLVNNWPEPESPVDYKLYWLKEFLVTHPFVDGNGRTAWVLQQWLFNSWEKPSPLHDFNFGGKNFIAQS